MKEFVFPLQLNYKTVVFKKIHFIGIGGSGMSGVAELLFYAGYHVTGSDIIFNSRVKRLIGLGVHVFLGHKAINVLHSDIVVVSSAINVFSNIEVLEANKINILVIHRNKLIYEISKCFYKIAISGTHGKTTVTAILSNIFTYSGLDPTFINGSVIKNLHISSKLGGSKYFIFEVDESNCSFLHFYPTVIVLTNIENDHLINYKGDFEKLKNAFKKFLSRIPPFGYIVLCIDDPIACKLVEFISCKVITYGFSNFANLQIRNYHQKGVGSFFIINRDKKTNLFVQSCISGFYNALNITAAIAVAMEEGVSDKDILKSLLDFRGVKSRFDNFGYYNLYCFNNKDGKVLLIFDYGHHPTEIRCMIGNVRNIWPKKRLVMVFQPHRYTRTRDLYNDFVNVLSYVDILLVMNIFSAGELPILGINSVSLCYDIKNKYRYKPIVVMISDICELVSYLKYVLQNNDLLLVQGAGSISNIVDKLFRFYFNKKNR